MVDRARIAAVTQMLRDARDEIERINEPYDPRLGAYQLQLAKMVQDIRDLPYHPPLVAQGGVV